jgi:uncharacterized protein (DUF983 family)
MANRRWWRIRPARTLKLDMSEYVPISKDRDGWTQRKCPDCDGHGHGHYDAYLDYLDSCRGCGGTGQEYISALDERAYD